MSSAAVLPRLILVCVAALLAVSCTTSEVTRTVNGETVEPQDPDFTPGLEEGDPCALDEALLEQLGVADMELTAGSGTSPTCSWEVNAFTSPRMYYWISEPSEPDPNNEVVQVAGVDAEIYLENEVDARYIVRTEEFTLDVAYLSDIESPDLPDGPAGAELVLEALLGQATAG